MTGETPTLTPTPFVPPPLSKEPWLAASLSLLIAGAGQVYTRHVVAAVLFFAGSTVLSTATVWTFFSASCGSWEAVAAAALATLALSFAAVVHAHRSARKSNSPEAEHLRKSVKDPWLAVFLTSILPGVGHLYLRRIGVGILLILGTVALEFLRPLHRNPWLFLVQFAYTALACLLVWRVAPKARRRGWKPLLILLVLGALADLVGIAGILDIERTYVGHFVVRSTGMVPTLQLRDLVLARKASIDSLHRGDLVVYHLLFPGGPDRVYISRLVAFAGETVECKDGGVFVDGKRLVEGVFGRLHYASPPAHVTAEEGKPYTVPKDSIFILGDNSADSLDGRYIGGLPAEDILGCAYKRVLPLSRFGPIE
jgi:signal peptidase I